MSRIDKILKSRKNELILDPEGNISTKYPNGYLIKKNIFGKLILLDSSIIDDYQYVAEEGYVTVADPDISELIALDHYNNFVRYKENQKWLWLDRLNKFKTVEYDENNNISFISGDYAQGGGGRVIYNGKQNPSLGNTFYRTGGLKYTFGVEIETNAGRLTNDDLHYSNASMEGDRTIRAYEYVSNILAGDAGIRKAELLANAISKRTIIGDENGLHVHIGGYKHYSKLWTPNFNRMFSINAIKLGVQIEDEMLGLIHPNRRKERYLKSIKPWANIDGENWRDVLGDYVFAGSNDIFRDERHYETHSLDEKHNTTFPISRWAKTKHKWMNLNHCNANSHVNTIEFRLFSATGSPDKVKNFILLCMAIVWFVENRQRMIWEGGVTLEKIVTEAMGSKPLYAPTYRSLLNFINKRKRNFIQ